MKNPLKIARTIVTYGSGIGATSITLAAIRHVANIAAVSNPALRVVLHLGAFGLAGSAGQMAFKYTGNEFDGYVKLIKSI